ncbi:hypothetical protein EXIGLDRAFT_829888 [Exidia glandulosa HHB12029]|uniref:Uncharacterized protein n=1 Tax=Exidia glandulosa HHB12029 TaxID=1314781 RepID=A0A165P5S6_EXIGL|nr:hypothetical protein EXIGLDRAFT_829888 [Exidia glandulosa HHB12029]
MYFKPDPSVSVHGSDCPGTPSSSASSSQSLGQGVTSTSGPSGGATVIPAVGAHMLRHISVENEPLPPSGFWTWFNAWFANGPPDPDGTLKLKLGRGRKMQRRTRRRSHR